MDLHKGKQTNGISLADIFLVVFLVICLVAMVGYNFVTSPSNWFEDSFLKLAYTIISIIASLSYVLIPLAIKSLPLKVVSGVIVLILLASDIFRLLEFSFSF
ncbi:hypothetical protein [Capnocytophaga canimorsus]|uniref:Uncharacterized protein n=1 Tax=Capnocytophaga canimorsus (strain 5) TaxID=860228 RepID=F9YQ01_CAPCC|nr:hypothetical protein [Capnocytophaga canimorsus]AEK22246.1 Hypothetical protein Ccan_01240 [Capnocytophaga canimorsus Cc5]WGU69105.1 hypothetical protein QIU19_04485 [Capnocytophaga canimorsus]WGU69785.1 hypothetical protein QIU18_09195 [Capnocytophaga canimorsus]